MKVQPLLVQVLMWIHLLTMKIMKEKAVKMKLVKRMMVQVRRKDLFDRNEGFFLRREVVMAGTLDLQGFIVRARVLKLYRKALWVVRRAPDHSRGSRFSIAF
ncbi:hypothetical protein LINPERHAP1_LOCUS42388 [Linum perenne]